MQKFQNMLRIYFRLRVRKERRTAAKRAGSYLGFENR